MAWVIVGAIGVGASLLSTGYEIYQGVEAQDRANTIAKNAAADAQSAEVEARAKQQATLTQQSELALKTQQSQNLPYTRSGTLLAGQDGLGSIGNSIGTQGSGKTLLGT